MMDSCGERPGLGIYKVGYCLKLEETVADLVLDGCSLINLLVQSRDSG